MGTQIKLVNMSDVAEQAGVGKTSQEEFIKLLSDAAMIAEFYSIGSGKGGRVMVRPESVEAAMRALTTTKGPARRSRGSGGVTPEPVVVREGIPPETIDEFRTKMATFEEKLSQLEDMFLEGDARVDQLHKAVENVTEVYAKLRKEVDPKAMLPEPPILPPQYQYKVLIAGGDYRILQRLESNFRTVRFVHMEGGGAAGVTRLTARTTLPKVDAVFILTTYFGHGPEAALFKYYQNTRTERNTPIHRVSGGISGLESALSLWLSERKREAEEK